MFLQNTIDQFLRDHIDPSTPCLIGLSGGADSMALFHLLMRATVKKPMFHVVHVNHGWREESIQEAEAVRALCRRYDIPCHIQTLDPKNFSGNLELASREERYRVFREVSLKTGAQGIFLGHHMNDQAETVLKRLFEGAGISRLGAMRPKTMYEKLFLYRPLLGIEKSTLEEYLKALNEPFFQDPTNTDTRFLRSRMRVEIFPYLRDAFGKEFEKNLIRLADSAHEIRSYFEERVALHLNEPVESDLGAMYDLSSHKLHPVEIREVVLKAVDNAAAVLSRSQVDTAVSFLIQGVSNKWLKTGCVELFFDRGRLFVMKPQGHKIVHQKSLNCVLRLGKQQIGPYSAVIEEVPERPIQKNHWIDLFRGELCTYLLPDALSEDVMFLLPAGKEELSSLKCKSLRAKTERGYKKLSSLISEYKVPLFLRTLAPVIVKGDVIYDDFLLGRDPDVTGSAYIKVSLTRKNM